ncbi:MAG: hypothetical protein IJV74_00955 [Clostridia bacterium]|nr:hypothetical protein [Clostridia bacterium]
MSRYNSYARELDKAFRKARNEYAELVNAVDMAKSKYNAANAGFAEVYTGERAVKQARAKANLLEAEEALRNRGDSIWREFYLVRDNLRRDLEKQVKADNMATPEDVDPNAIELLKSDILGADEMVALAEKYDANPTMLKLIAKYAGEKAMNSKNELTSHERTVLYAVAGVCKDGGGSVMRAWDSLAKNSNYCSGGGHDGNRRRSPGHAVAMGEKWEELCGAAIESF